MTLEQIAVELTKLSSELHNIAANLSAAAPLVAPVQPAAVLPPRPAGPDSGAAANHLASILYGHPTVLPHAPTPTVPPEVMARYQADAKAFADAFRSMGPLGAFHAHLQPPNLNDYRNNHAYIWPGHAILANTQPGHFPRPL